MTLSELAEAARVSLPYASKCAKDGKFPFERQADGSMKIDAAHPAVVKFMIKRRDEKPARPPKATAEKKPKPSMPPAADAPPVPPHRPPPASQPAAVDLDDKKTEQQIEKLRLENEATRRELVPREDVRSVFLKFYGIHASILGPLSSKIGRDLAVALGHTDPESALKSEEIVDREIFEALGSIERQMQEYLLTLELES